MIFDTSKDKDLNDSINYIVRNQGKMIEVKIKRGNRTLGQNSYIHLLFGLFGVDFGLTLDESKQLIKSMFLSYDKKGKKFVKRTRDLDTKEMTTFIDKFRKFSEEQGCYLPEANEKEKLRSLQNMLETNKWI